MKRTRTRRRRYQRILDRLRPVSTPPYVLDVDDFMADLDKGHVVRRLSR